MRPPDLGFRRVEAPPFTFLTHLSTVEPAPRIHEPTPNHRQETSSVGETESVGGFPRHDLPAQVPPPPARPQYWATRPSPHADVLSYAVIFLLVGLPVYYAINYAMPIQLTISVLAYFAALEIPPRWRQFLHPVLVSSLFTVFGLWVLGLVKGHSLSTSLAEYRTGVKYLQLWQGEHRFPGAGDVFSTILDASIVALALPMYQYRRELKQHFLAITVPNTVVSIASLFSYPYICAAIGISGPRSLAFAARSLTLALATPAIANLGGDVNTVAAVAIMSGILGVLVGQKMLAVMRIPEGMFIVLIHLTQASESRLTTQSVDDYVTRGVTLGANSSAIATALLLRTDPRAAALSSLSMSLLGTITVLFTSMPPIVAVVRSLVTE